MSYQHSLGSTTIENFLKRPSHGSIRFDEFSKLTVQNSTIATAIHGALKPLLPDGTKVRYGLELDKLTYAQSYQGRLNWVLIVDSQLLHLTIDVVGTSLAAKLSMTPLEQVSRVRSEMKSSAGDGTPERLDVEVTFQSDEPLILRWNDNQKYLRLEAVFGFLTALQNARAEGTLKGARP